MRRLRDDLGRRTARQTIVASAPAEPEISFAAANMPANNDGFYLQLSGAPATLVGGSTALSVACVFRLNALPSADEGLICAGRGSSDIALTRGWMLYNQSTANTRGAIKLSGGGTNYTDSNNWAAGDVDKIHRLVMTYDGTTQRLYRNGVEIGTGAAASGTLDRATGSDRLTIGYTYLRTNTHDLDVDIIGFGIDDAVMSGANVATWDAAVQASATGMAQLTTGGVWWQADSWDGSTGSNVWDDESSTYSLTTASTTENKITITSPVWGT